MSLFIIWTQVVKYMYIHHVHAIADSNLKDITISKETGNEEGGGGGGGLCWRC